VGEERGERQEKENKKWRGKRMERSEAERKRTELGVEAKYGKR
jgi:hypothetical protein